MKSICGGVSVASPADDNDLVNRHYVTLIVRLTVDHHGQLVRGEMVDATNTFHERFIGGNGLIGAVQAWLARQERDGAGRREAQE